MTEPTPQPTLADVLAAIRSLTVKVDGVDTRTASVEANLAALSEKTDANQLATGARFDLLDSRHTEHAQTLDALSGMAYEQKQASEALPAHLDVVIARAEARLTSRVSDVQQVVQALKADLAAHTSDPNVHQP